MSRSLALSLLLSALACRATPVLNDKAEEPDAPSAAASATASGVASVAPSAAPSAWSPVPVQSYPVEFSGFPRCPPERPPEPPEPLVWVGPGDAFQAPKKKPHHDQFFDVHELGHRLETCLQRTVHEPARLAVTIGIEPSGKICAPQMVSTVPLAAECVACLAKRFRAYRFEPGEGSAPLTFNMPRFTPAATSATSAR